jgi:hypothetical protein
MLRISSASKSRLLVVLTAEIFNILREPLTDDGCGLGRAIGPVVAAIAFVYVRPSQTLLSCSPQCPFIIECQEMSGTFAFKSSYTEAPPVFWTRMKANFLSPFSPSEANATAVDTCAVGPG